MTEPEVIPDQPVEKEEAENIIINNEEEENNEVEVNDNFNDDPEQPETIEGLREQVLKLRKELMEAQYEFRQKNKENADLRLKEKKDLNERIQSQSLVIEELKSKIGDIDILNQKISTLTEEKNHLLLENSQQKEKIQELMENQNAQYNHSLNYQTETLTSGNNFTANDESKAAIIRNMIDISTKIKNSFQEIKIAQKND